MGSGSTVPYTAHSEIVCFFDSAAISALVNFAVSGLVAVVIVTLS